MSAKTISHCQGKGSIAHNNRTFKPRNVDSTKSCDNITFVKIPISEAYETCFSEAVERYNAKQKRADRRIKNGYFDYAFSHAPCNNVITAPDKRKSFYEDIIQIGCREDTGTGTIDGNLAVKCLTEYMQGFQKRNPNFYVFNAVLHNDEATPHLHIDYIPIGHYKRGVDTQNGLAQALKEMGYGEGENAISRWRTAEYNILTDICVRHGIEISSPQKSRGYSYTVEEYKKHMDRISELEQQIAVTRKSIAKENEHSVSLRQKSRREFVIAEQAKKEAAKAQDDIALERRVLALKNTMLQQMLKIHFDKERELDEEIETMRSDYCKFIEMKKRFVEYARSAISKIKNETKRNALTNQLNANMFIYDSQDESLEDYAERITQKSKSKDKDFSL